MCLAEIAIPELQPLIRAHSFFFSHRVLAKAMAIEKAGPMMVSFSLPAKGKRVTKLFREETRRFAITFEMARRWNCSNQRERGRITDSRELSCAIHGRCSGPDVDGATREIIVFHLVPLVAEQSDLPELPNVPTSLDELRRQAFDASNTTALPRKQVVQNAYFRSHVGRFPQRAALCK